MPEAGGSFVVPAQDLLTTVRYAGASGDFNPLHYDPAAAERARFPRVLVHGGWLAAHCEQLLAPLLDYRSLAVRFERPVMIGEALDLEWTRDDKGVAGTLISDGARRVSARLDHAPAPAERPDDYREPIEPYPWVFEEGALRLFVEALSVETGTSGKVPLSFMANASRWNPSGTSAVRGLGFDYARMLHGSTRTDLFGPMPQVGERFAVHTAYASRLEKPHRDGGTMRQADILNEIRDADRGLRVRIVNRFIERPKRG